jgi:hypothetical protein
MRRLVFVGIMGLLSMVINAQSWTVDGNIFFGIYKWDNGSSLEKENDFSISLKVGKYVSKNFNIGLRAGLDDGNITIGPVLKYDYYKIDKIYFSVTGGVYYTQYNDSYFWNDNYPENDAGRIIAGISPSVAYIINKNIEIYWQFATLAFCYDWLTLKNTNIDCTATDFWISGPFTDPSFGIIFRF